MNSSSNRNATRSSAPPNGNYLWSDWIQGWFEPVEIHCLVYFRILFGALIAALIVYKYFWLGLLEQYFVYPSYNFSYYGFSWVKPVSSEGMYVVFSVMLVSAIGVTLGLFYRVSASLLWLTWTYIFLCDKATYQNHHYLVALIAFWMIFIPANGKFSFDAHLWKKYQRETAPTWALWVLRLFIAIPYFYGAIAKMNMDWLLAKPTWIWVEQGLIGQNLPEFMKAEPVAWFMSYYGLLFDLLVVPALLWGRTRLLACLAILAFHVSNSIIFSIGLFPWMMLFSTLLFFPTSLLKNLIQSIRKEEKFQWDLLTKTEFCFAGSSSTNSSNPLSINQKLTVIALILFFGFQFLFPLRHWFYEGQPSWNGKGDLFAWRMMLDDKNGVTEFLIRNNKNDSEFVIKMLDPEHPVRLTRLQQLSMIRVPDMVLQYAHYLEQEYVNSQLGLVTPEDISVFANVQVSLNGRPMSPLIDPRIDLTLVSRTLVESGTWTLPLPETRP